MSDLQFTGRYSISREKYDRGACIPYISNMAQALFFILNDLRFHYFFILCYSSVFRRWRYLQICFSFLNLLIRYDVPLPANAVKLCVKFLNHDALAIRKVSAVEARGGGGGGSPRIRSECSTA